MCAESGMPNTTREITGLHKVLGRDYGIEESYRGLVISFSEKNSSDYRLSRYEVPFTFRKKHKRTDADNRPYVESMV